MTNNPNVQLGFTAATLRWAFNIGECGNWHPLTWMSHMLDCRLFGLNPRGHHGMGLILHVVNVILLFLVLTRLTRSRWASGLAAALFAIHPLHVESVAWVAERKDLLSISFWMLATGAYALYSEKPSFGRYSLVVLTFALGLMCKPMLITLPLTLLLLDYWPLRRFEVSSFGALVVEKIPLFVLSLGSSVITYVAQQRGEAVSPLDLIPLAMRIENAVVSYAAYIVKMIWPTQLAVLYPYPMSGLPAWQVIGAAAAIACLSYLAVRMRQTRPYLLVGWLWYLVTLIPVIGLIQVGAQAMADRYTYVPLIGLFITIAWEAAERMGERENGRVGARTAVVAVCVLVLALLAVQTRKQVGYWKDDLALFGHAVECTRDNYTMHNSLGLALADHGNLEGAKEQFEEAIRISPNYVSARLDLGITLCDMGRMTDAISQFEEAIRIKPNYADSYYNMGRALDGIGDAQRAGLNYQKALDLDPKHAQAHINLGNILVKNRAFDEAIRHYQAALDVNPLQLEAHVDLANALQSSGDSDGAVREYRTALRIKPDYGVAHMNLAIVLYLRGEYAEAWREARLAETCGQAPNPGFMRALSEKMPEPPE